VALRFNFGFSHSQLPTPNSHAQLQSQSNVNNYIVPWRRCQNIEGLHGCCYTFNFSITLLGISVRNAIQSPSKVISQPIFSLLAGLDSGGEGLRVIDFMLILSRTKHKSGRGGEAARGIPLSILIYFIDSSHHKNYPKKFIPMVVGGKLSMRSFFFRPSHVFLMDKRGPKKQEIRNSAFNISCPEPSCNKLKLMNHKTAHPQSIQFSFRKSFSPPYFPIHSHDCS
jgi:hypothetical protein